MRAWTLAAIASFAVCCYGCCILRFWAKGVTLDGVATVAVFMGALLGFWLLHVRVETRHVHAERLLAKVGGSNRKPRGIPTLATRAQRKWKGRSAAEVCTSEARKIGEWLAGARGDLPLGVFVVAFVVAFQQIRVGVAGRTQARWVGQRKTAKLPEAREGTPTPSGRSLRVQGQKLLPST